MAEIITLTAPVAKPSTTAVRIERLIIDVEQRSIHIQWLGNNNEAGSAVYSTPPPPSKPTQPSGATLLTQLNTANLTTQSLINRVLRRLQTDGYIGAGNVAGAPE